MHVQSNEHNPCRTFCKIGCRVDKVVSLQDLLKILKERFDDDSDETAVREFLQEVRRLKDIK